LRCSSFFLFTGVTLFLAGCGRSGPDYTPIGDGMKMIGICLVLCALVGALAELILNHRDGED